jgi:hypothetical protein
MMRELDESATADRTWPKTGAEEAAQKSGITNKKILLISARRIQDTVGVVASQKPFSITNRITRPERVRLRVWPIDDFSSLEYGIIRIRKSINDVTTKTYRIGPYDRFNVFPSIRDIQEGIS